MMLEKYLKLISFKDSFKNCDDRFDDNIKSKKQ